MPKFAIQFAFDGTDFCGWQVQRGVGSHQNPKPSLEGSFVSAIRDVCEETVNVVASGRTDAGVHGSGQVAHFTLDSSKHDTQNLLRALNRALPPSIQIHHLSEAPVDFSARQAIRKQYSYYFQQGPSNLPHLKKYTMWNRQILDGELMQEGIQHLIGKHDFIPFGSASANVASTIREIHEAEVTRESIPLPGCFDAEQQFLWRVRIVGSGFLMHMMRSIAGTLKQIGEERRPPSDIAHILETKDRQLAGPTAPASGLWLDQVWFHSDAGVTFLEPLPFT